MRCVRHGVVEATIGKAGKRVHGVVEGVIVVHHHDTHAGWRLCQCGLTAAGPHVAGDGIGRSVIVHVSHAEVTHCGGACLSGVHVLKHHLDCKANLGQVHDALHGHAGCTDDLGLEENVELRHFSVARKGAVSSALEGLHGVVGDFTCTGIVAVDGACGGDVVGERADLFGDRRRTAHDLSEVRDVPGVVITLSG